MMNLAVEADGEGADAAEFSSLSFIPTCMATAAVDPGVGLKCAECFWSVADTG